MNLLDIQPLNLLEKETKFGKLCFLVALNRREAFLGSLLNIFSLKRIEMKIILVRHGESIANSKGISQGNQDEWEDTNLTEKGFKQARGVAERLREEPIDLIFSSDLKRAKQTAEEINKFHNVPIQLEPNLRDMTNNEDLEKFILKCKEVFKKIEELNKNVLVVAHGSSCLTLLAITTGNREEGGKLVRQHSENYGNTCVSLVEKEGDKYKIKFVGCGKHLDGFSS